MPRVSDKLNLWNAQILVDFCNLEPAQVEDFHNKHLDFVPQKWWDQEVVADNPEYVKQLDRAIKKQLSAMYEKGDLKEPLTDEQYREKIKPTLAKIPEKVRTYQWQVTQRRLREWWGSKFKDDITSLVILLDMIYDPDPDTNRARTLEHVFREILPRTWEPEKGETIINRKGNTITFPKGPVATQLPLILGVNFSNLRQGYIPMQGAIVYLFADPWRARFCPVCRKPFVAAESRTKFCSSSCSEKDRRRQKREWGRENLKAWRRKQKTKKRPGK